ncbi:MAG: hypothetical protein GX128_07820 [Bacteroidales bacterium]|jgi:hypothetical protein|nr:hypothetical protein [Bacteroidales bacterium]
MISDESINIESTIKKEGKITKDNILLFDKIVKHIDVYKIIFKYYDLDLSKPQSKSEISNISYISLFHILKTSGDYKFLNSAFKLNDLMLSKAIIDESTYYENIKELKETFYKI